MNRNRPCLEQRLPCVNLPALFRSAVAELRVREIPFAVAGGFAADLYRREPRVTMDVDIAILAGAKSFAVAKEVVRRETRALLPVRLRFKQPEQPAIIIGASRVRHGLHYLQSPM